MRSKSTPCSLKETMSKELSNRANVKLTPQQVARRQTDAEVLELLLEYRTTQSDVLRDRIVAKYTNLVESIARRFSGAAEPIEDLAQEGYIGLITAIDLYDSTKNVKFSTYATHFIIGQIKHCLRDRGKIIKEPAWLQELNQRMTRVIDTLVQQFSRPPSNLEIARMMQMTEESVAEMMMTREVFKVTSIDGGSEDENDSGTVDMDRKQSRDVAVAFQLPIEDRIVLETAMQKLKALEQRVLIEFYFKDLNQTEIAKQLGISCNYVSHILRNSAKKLKKILITDDLRSSQIKAAQIRRRMEDQAFPDSSVIVDPLTHLYNRHYYESRLQEEQSRSGLNGQELSIVMLRCYGIAEFNRVQGTLKGDELITGFALVLGQCVRRVDIVTRYSEDIFALILPRTGGNVCIVTERVSVALTDWLAEKGWDTGRGRIVFTIGSAVYSRKPAQSISLTEEALQRAELKQETPPEELRRAA